MSLFYHIICLFLTVVTITHELKGLGRNLNQLTMLAHQGRLSAPDLSGMIRVLDRVYDRLGELAGQERR